MPETYQLEAYSKQETCQWYDLGKHSKGRVSNQASRYTIDGLPVNLQAEVWRHYKCQSGPAQQLR